VLLAALTGEMDFRAASLASGWGRIAALLLSVGAATLVAGDSIEALLWALAGGEAVSAILAARLLGTRHPQDSVTGGSSMRFRAGLPFALSGIMVVAYNRLDVIVVAAIASSGVVGTYAPASRLQDALYIAPFAVSTVLFPLLARMGTDQGNRRKLVRTFWRGTAASVAVSVVAALAAFLLLGPIIRNFAPDYVDSIEPCRIIVWSLPVVALNACFVSLLNAAGRADLVPYGVAAALVSSLGFNLILVPVAEADGAALAACLRDVPAALVLITAAFRCGALRRHDRIPQGP
jgi:O-antigen/teichoic acid export membrane protein